MTGFFRRLFGGLGTSEPEEVVELPEPEAPKTKVVAALPGSELPTFAIVRTEYTDLLQHAPTEEGATVQAVETFLSQMQGTDTQLLGILEDLLRTLYPKAYAAIEAARALINESKKAIIEIEGDIAEAEFDEDKAAYQKLKKEEEAIIQKMLQDILEILLHVYSVDLIHKKALELQSEIDKTREQARKRISSREKVLTRAKETAKRKRRAAKISTFADHGMKAIVGAVAPEVIGLVERMVATRRLALPIVEILHAKGSKLTGDWDIGHALEADAAGQAQVAILGQEVVDTLESIGDQGAVDDATKLLTGKTIQEAKVISLVDDATAKMQPYLLPNEGPQARLTTPTTTASPEKKPSTNQIQLAQILNKKLKRIHSETKKGEEATKAGKAMILETLQKTPQATSGLSAGTLSWLITNYPTEGVLMIIAKHPHAKPDILCTCIYKGTHLKKPDIVYEAFINQNNGNDAIHDAIKDAILSQEVFDLMYKSGKTQLIEIFFSKNSDDAFRLRLIKKISEQSKNYAYDKTFYTIAKRYVDQYKTSQPNDDIVKVILEKLLKLGGDDDNGIDKYYYLNYANEHYLIAPNLADTIVTCHFAGPVIGENVLRKSGKEHHSGINKKQERTLLLLANPHCKQEFREQYIEHDLAHLRALIENPSTETHILNNIAGKVTPRDQKDIINHPNAGTFVLELLENDSKDDTVKREASEKLTALAA